MDLKQCIKTRRSIRKYKDKTFSKEILEDIIDSVRYAPSSHNTQPWDFIVVDKKELKEQLSQVHQWAGFAKDSATIIAVCYDTNKCKWSPSKFANPAIAATYILLSAHEAGLGACWIFIKDSEEPEIEKKVKSILGVPKFIDIFCMISLGYPDETPDDKDLRDLKDLIHYNKWN